MKVFGLALLGVLGGCRAQSNDIVATGTVEITEVDIAPLVTARVARMFVDDGSTVRVGDTIAVLTQPTARAEVEQRSARVAASRAGLSELEHGSRAAEIRRAEAELRVAEAEAVRASADANRYRRLEVRVQPWYNPGLRSEAYIIPGMIGILLSLTLIVVTSIALVRERERGTLEQLVVTPISKTSIMLGKILPFVLVAYVQVTWILILGKLLFDIPLRGSIVLLYVLALPFIVANLALELFVSTVARNQLQAMQLGVFLLLPTVLLSGFIFPRDAMPDVARWIGLALPLTHYLTVLRGILLKGIGLEHLWHETLILSLFAAALVSLSVRRFSKTVQ